LLLKRWIIQPSDDIAATRLSTELNIQLVLGKLLIQRGINSFEEAKRFFRPSIEHLHDPFLMQDMDKAVVRIEEAIEHGEKVMLYGDYDVDGTTSVALMHEFLEPRVKKLDYYIPDRYKEGYGVSFASIEYAKQHHVKLIIAMDCGIKAQEQVALASSYGIDFIVCDHHTPDETLPAAIAVLDPKRTDCNYPFKELSGCGIAFKLAQAIVKKHGEPIESLYPLLDLLAVSIACDLVLIQDENRVLAHFGLVQFNNHGRIGLKALVSIREKEFPLNINDIVFGIGPLINAAGRLGDARLAVRLLLARDRLSATNLAQELVAQNELRREAEAEMGDEVSRQINEQIDAGRKSLVLFCDRWHKGIVGIIAARVAESAHRPTFVLTAYEGKVMGSVRTINGFDVYEALRECEGLMESFGGHPFAAGLVMLPENLDAFREQIEMVTQKNMRPEQMLPEVGVNAIIDITQITPKFYNILKQFAPFGPGNMRPVFLATALQPTQHIRVSRNEMHLLFSIKQTETETMQGAAFGQGHLYDALKTAKSLDMCFVLEESYWNGKPIIRFQAKDLRLK
jgi:single-stranded-DNA-specific exonuclease